MTEEKKEETEKPKGTPLGKSTTDPDVTKEQLQAQLNYAQKIINVLQGKVNEANGRMVQVEAQLELANEDRANMLKQLEPMGITPTE
jgi:hypothetical protein